MSDVMERPVVFSADALHLDDRRLFGYFRQDLLETRFLSKGRRVDLIQLWNWFVPWDNPVTGTYFDKSWNFLIGTEPQASVTPILT